MKIKRFLAGSMREAIRHVREELGDDAVILSNRRVAGGLEVVAATDYDAALMQAAVRRQDSAEPTEAPAATAAPDSGSAPVPARLPDDFQQLRREMSRMRQLLEQQSAQPHPLTGAAMSPQRSAALRTLNELGIEPSLAIAIADSLPGDADQEKARLLPLGLLARRLPVHPADRILEGGIIALVGPTGVGKTTTLAKLAARFAARFGTRDLALLSTDHYRVGAQEQLFTYGRLLGVPVQTVDSAQALREGLLRFADRKLVLIDTAGMAPRDRQLTQQLAELHAAGRPIERWLVLSATTQASDQDEILRCYGPAQPKAAVLTKVDEATRLGGALSTLIRHRLPLTYVCDGQQVPEDIRIARADQLVLRAMQAARRAAAVLAQPEVKHAQA
jgi:flagellar biosynthesis protein FlhF